LRHGFIEHVSILESMRNTMASGILRSRVAHVQQRSARDTRGVLSFGAMTIPCALGRSGVVALKREGDGASPRGLWSIREIYYRADRVARPATDLPVRRLRPDQAWCDVSGDRNYNRLVRLPYSVLDERLWRKDGLYDIIGVLSHNVRPRVQGLGSAIFLHVAREGYLPTAGCVALALEDLQRLLAYRGGPAMIRFGPSH
ncbi:MAG: L,D-transpeptidase family protein, partial [Pseudomonadota bacterium]